MVCVSSRLEQRKLEKKKTLTREVNVLKYESSFGWLKVKTRELVC
jgi:hypothetical protein